VAEPRYELRPIGRVEVSKEATFLRIDEAFRSALEGLVGFSHVIVVFWFHLTDTDELRSVLTCDRPYTNGPDRLGIFATRSPTRPNPIGITPVSLLHVDTAEGVIHVPFIDAEDGTPILDLKPYQPSLDRIRDVRTPDWCAHWPQWSEDSGTFDWEAEFSSP
jgi:tRNA-Thr(GGU) m(6)t(6)A37 methyltransferase TsaA